jgi:hypothetical protein
VRSILASIRVWAIEVSSAWFAWAIAILTRLANAAESILPGFHVPRSVLVAGYTVAFIAANVWAYHKSASARWLSRPRRLPSLDPLLERARTSPQTVTAQRNAQLGALGIVNPLVVLHGDQRA